MIEITREARDKQVRFEAFKRASEIVRGSRMERGGAPYQNLDLFREMVADMLLDLAYGGDGSGKAWERLAQRVPGDEGDERS